MKAFPHTYDQIIDGHVATCTNYGMDLRDWFAGLAMQDFMTSRDALEYEEIAELSYELAEQMMKARNI
jgi:hypothetical protein